MSYGMSLLNRKILEKLYTFLLDFCRNRVILVIEQTLACGKEKT
jgi:hypothetical protein